MIINEKSVRF